MRQGRTRRRADGARPRGGMVSKRAIADSIYCIPPETGCRESRHARPARRLTEGPTEAAREPPPVRFYVRGGRSVKQQCQTRDEFQSRADEKRRLDDPFGENRTAEEDWLKDPFRYSYLRSLAVKIPGLPDGRPDWVATTGEMLRVFAGFTNPDDTAV